MTPFKRDATHIGFIAFNKHALFNTALKTITRT